VLVLTWTLLLILLDEAYNRAEATSAAATTTVVVAGLSHHYKEQQEEVEEEQEKAVPSSSFAPSPAPPAAPPPTPAAAAAAAAAAAEPQPLPPRCLRFLTPLRGVACLLILTHHFVFAFLVLVNLPSDVSTPLQDQVPYRIAPWHHPIVQMLWGNGPLVVRLFSLITGRVALVQYMRQRQRGSAAALPSLVRSMVQRYCRLGGGVLGSVLCCVAMSKLGAQDYVQPATLISRSATLYLRAGGRAVGDMTFRECLALVKQLMSMDVLHPTTTPLR
jgi:hypothetical protein